MYILRGAVKNCTPVSSQTLENRLNTVGGAL